MEQSNKEGEKGIIEENMHDRTPDCLLSETGNGVLDIAMLVHYRQLADIQTHETSNPKEAFGRYHPLSYL